VQLAALTATTRDGRLRPPISELLWQAKTDQCAAIVIENLDFAGQCKQGH